MKKKLLSILLTVCMVLSLVPAAAVPVFADTVNYTIVLKDGTVSKYENGITTPITDPAELAALGITGDNTGAAAVYTFNGVYFVTNALKALEIQDDSATVKLVGSNFFSFSFSSTDYGYAIKAKSLTVTAEDPTAALTAWGGLANYGGASYGIDASGTLTVTGGKVTASGGFGGTYSYGIDAADFVISGGEVVAESALVDTASNACGINVTNSFTATGGKVTATGGATGDNGGNSYGIQCANFAVSGTASVTAAGSACGLVYAYSYGVKADQATVTGGSVTASGHTAAFKTAPTATGMQVKADTDTSGASAVVVTDLAANNASYRYVKIESASAPTVPTTKDYTIVLSGGTVKDQNGIDLTETGISWDTANSCYVFTDVDFTTTAATAIQIKDSAATVTLVGNNTVVSGDHASGSSYGISADGSLHLRGSGTLHVTSGTASGTDSNSYGMRVEADLEVSDCTVIALGNTAEQRSYGIYIKGELSIGSGSVTATGGKAKNDSNGIRVRGLADFWGGVVTATGGEADVDSVGLYFSDAAATVRLAAKVSGIGGAAAANSYGIRAAAKLTVADGDVTATGGTAYATVADANNDSYGMRVISFVQNGGKVIATGGTADSTVVGEDCDSYGIYLTSGGSVGDITVTGGRLIAHSGASKASSKAIYAEGNTSVTVSGGTVEAVGGSSAESTMYGLDVRGVITVSAGEVLAVAIHGERGRGFRADAAEIVGGKVLAQGSEYAMNKAPITANMQVTADTSLTGYTAAEVSTWEGMGLEDVSAYKYMNFERLLLPIAAGKTLYLKEGKLFDDPACSTQVRVDGITGAASGSGYSYTFDNVNFITTATTAIAILDQNATISLVGDSIVTADNVKDSESYGIRAFENLTFTGEGSLQVTGGAASVYSCGIRGNSITVEGGTVTAVGGESPDYSFGILGVDITVSGGNVTATGGKSHVDSAGIYCVDDFTMTDGSVTVRGGASKESHGILNRGTQACLSVSGGVLKAYGYTEQGSAASTAQISYGILFDNVDISGTAEVEAIGGEATNGKSYGIMVKQKFTVSGGSVTAKGGAAYNNSYGICGSGVNISGGTVKATGGAAQTYGSSCGIYCDNFILSNPGEVEAIGGAAKVSSYGIYAEFGSVTVQGGKVTATGGAAESDYSYGIAADSIITVQGGTVTAAGDAQGRISYGIYSNAAVKIEGDSVVDATGGAAEYSSYGIYGLSMSIDGGKVTAIGGETGDSYGISGSMTVQITGGTVKATGGTADGNSMGIYSASNVTVSGGTVTATGGAADFSSCGIYSNTNITISGTAEVEAKGGMAALGSYGIFSSNVIAISGGSVTAIGGAADNGSWGIHSLNAVTVSGGNVTATGGEAIYGNSYGIYSDTDITVSGGTVVATGGVAGHSYGICTGSTGSITIGYGTVTARGNTSALNKAPSTQITKTVYAAANADGSDAADITANWIGDGSDDISGYQYMQFAAPALAADQTLYLKDGKLYNNEECEAEHEVRVDGITGNGDAANGYTYLFDNVNLDSEAATAISILDDNATIQLKGSNTVVSGEVQRGTRSIGIQVMGGSLTITGDGSLDVTGSSSGENSAAGLFVKKNLTVKDVTVRATAQDVAWTDASTGMHVEGNLTIQNAVVEATSNAKAIFAKDIVITDSTVTATSGDAAQPTDSSYGIHGKNITVSGSTITATSGEGTFSNGIYAMLAVNIEDSIVTATGDTANTHSSGLTSQSDATTITNSRVTATAGDSPTASNGICAKGITVDGGSVTASAGTSSSSWGIYSYTINNGDGHFTVNNDAKLELSGENGASDVVPNDDNHTGDPILVGNAADGSDAKPMDEWTEPTFKYLFTKAQNPVTPYQPPVMRLDNFESATGEFNEIAYYAREARAGDIVTLKVALSELGKKYGLDFTKITVEYEVQGAAQLGGNYLYTGDPLYVDGIATDFMLGEGFNKMVAKVYYNGIYSGDLAPFYAWVE